MTNTLKLVSRLCIAGFALLGLGSLGGCISDNSDSGDSGGSAGSGGSSGGSGGTGAGTGGSSAGTSSAGTGGGGPAGSVCATPIVVGSSKPAIASFEDYMPGADLSTWFFPLGGDTTSGILSGPFGYGDDVGGKPEQFQMVAGHDSTYALLVSDTLAEQYGGGMGLWISECLNATAFSGISFWVRGNSPTGDAKLSILMQETTSATAAGDAKGTCPGTDTDMTCVHPSYVLPVTDTWTQVRAAWSAFTKGMAGGMQVTPDGRNIWQIQFDVGLVWAPDDAGVYQPTPAAYEFEVDDLAFY